MPEMALYCGTRHRLTKRIERTCEEVERNIRRIEDIIFLDDLRCDGSFHGDCQKGCKLFWKGEWLQRQGPGIKAANKDLIGDPLFDHLRSKYKDGSYFCQSTELMAASTPLSLLDMMSYVRDVRSRTYSILELISNVLYALMIRIRYLLTGTPFRFLQGRQTETPHQALNLQPGERVQVKNKEEIRKTLDANGMNRGLRFTLDMVPYCGRTFRVLRRVEKMIYEPTRTLIRISNTVVLEDSICRGCHVIKGGCPRENFNLWREIWLRRVAP
jgi:hypothetical protein